MNLPNKLTIFRIILVPIMVIIPYLGLQGEVFGIPITMLIIDAIFIIASITDKLDGTLARKYNQITTFGKFLDPIADKILVLAAMIMLVEFGKIPSWIPIIILFREFIVSGYRLVAVQESGEVIAASKWGKIKTVTQMIAIIMAFLDIGSFCEFLSVSNGETGCFTNLTGYMYTGAFVFNILTSLMFIVCVIATIFSGYEYVKNGKELLLKDK
jgi:CDP-diacylglycerol--glycerol-3-phosphate 3-phosphatidyltransferase